MPTVVKKQQRRMLPRGMSNRVKNQALGWAAAKIEIGIWIIETIQQFENMPAGCMFYIAKKKVVDGVRGIYGVKIIVDREQRPSRDGAPSNHSLVVTRYVDHNHNRIDECTGHATGKIFTIEELL